jgi:FkbM family methyltransferase
MRSILRSLAKTLRPDRKDKPPTVARSVRHEGHHAVFDLYEPFSGHMAEGFSYSFLGDRFRAEFGGWSRPPAAFANLTPPPMDEEYLEWLDILEAATEAGDTFTFLELGAGFGRWSVRAALAGRQQGKRIVVGLAEADPRHVSFIHTNMADNGIGSDEYRVYEAAVSGSAGNVVFCVGTPEHGEEWYGQSIIGDEVGDSPVMGDYFGHPLYSYQGGWAHVIKLKQITLSDILENYERIDLADLDLQSAEADAVAEAIVPLTAKVRRLHIGTHGEEVEARLRDILARAGWIKVRDHSCNQLNDTEFGTFEFNDGVQTWLNPRLG